MQDDNGITIEGAQYAICLGTYGGKEWTKEQKQDACQKYESLTGNKIETDNGYNYLPISMTVIILLGAVILTYVLINRKKSLKTNKHIRKNTQK